MPIVRDILRSLGLGVLKRAVLGAPKQRARILFPDRPKSIPSRYLSVVAMFKNEGPYLAEWLELHRLVGVEHVYLYDNGSTDNSHSVLAPFVQQGFVTLVPWFLPRPVGSVTAQIVAYAHAVLNFGRDWRWMSFIDIDEFLFPVESNSLPDLLSRYEDLPAIAAFWTMFGFSGNKDRPNGLVIENYTMRAPFPTHAKPKSIVNPAEVVAVASAHLFDLTIGPRRAFTESRQLIYKANGITNCEGESNILRLNHYYTRSRAELDEKITKRIAAGRNHANLVKIRSVVQMIEAAPSRDDTILRFVPALKARLACYDAALSSEYKRRPADE